MIKTFEQKLTKETKVGQISEYKLWDFLSPYFLVFFVHFIPFCSNSSLQILLICHPWNALIFQERSEGLRTPARLIKLACHTDGRIGRFLDFLRGTPRRQLYELSRQAILRDDWK